MPLYEVVLEQRYANQQCINRFNYVGTGTPSAVQPAFGLLSALGFLAVSTTFADGTVARAIQNLQNPTVFFIQATARAIYVDEDFYGNGFLANTVGASVAGGDNASPLIAFGFRSNRVKQSIGRGYKRFVGAAEGNMIGGGLWGSATLAQMGELAEFMGDTLSYDDEGNTLSFSPCVVQKQKYTTPSGKNAYKYYGTELLQAPHLAVGIAWESYQELRSQTSRQYGRGS